MKLYVILVGLIGIVPPQGLGTNVIALLRNAEDGAVSSSGVHIPPHYAFALYRPEGARPEEKAALRLEGEDISFPSTMTSAPIINDPGNFVSMADILSPQVARVKPGCLGRTPATLCRADGQPLLAARVVMPTGSIFPLEVGNLNSDRTYNVTRALVRNKWSIRSPISRVPHRPGLSAAANGTLLILDVPFNMAAMQVGSSSLRIGQAPPAECDSVLGSTSPPCAIVWILNLPDQRASHGGPVKLGDQDNHFELYYDLLVDEPNERFVPYLRMRRDLGVSETDPPGAQCLQPMLQP